MAGAGPGGLGQVSGRAGLPGPGAEEPTRTGVCDVDLGDRSLGRDFLEEGQELGLVWVPTPLWVGSEGWAFRTGHDHVPGGGSASRRGLLPWLLVMRGPLDPGSRQRQGLGTQLSPTGSAPLPAQC